LGKPLTAEPVVRENLQKITAFPAKNVKITGIRIAAQRLLDLQGELVHASAHIRGAGRQPPPLGTGIIGVTGPL
jgi:hypothetical protein